jgi:endonuclease-3
MPVDTHIHRIARRLGLVPAKLSADQTQRMLQPLIPRDRRYSMHVLLIEHGRKTCRAISPACEDCALLGLCSWGRERLHAMNE